MRLIRLPLWFASVVRRLPVLVVLRAAAWRKALPALSLRPVLLALVLPAVLLAGCAAQEAFRESKERFGEGQHEAGFAKLSEALKIEPNNAEFRSYYLQTRDRLVNGWLREADLARAANQPETARALYERALSLDAANPRAQAGLRHLENDKKIAAWQRDAEAALEKKDFRSADARVREVLALDPANARALAAQQRVLEATRKPPVETAMAAGLRRPLTIEFKDAPLKQVFEVLSRTSGLNFIFDRDVRADQRVTIFMRSTTVQDAVNQLLVTNQLEQRVLDAMSIMVFPNNPAKLRDYQPLVVRSFYLNNADAKVVATTLRTILKTRDIITDDKLNMIIMRDSPESVRLAERLVAMHDVNEPEVMLDVEIMEVSRTRLQNLGVRFPDSLTFTPLAGAAGTVTMQALRQINESAIGVTGATLGIAANKTDTDANLLANPRIRVKNREKANILIGDRVPNITTTSTATGFVSESVTYVDVGLKLDVETVIHPDNEVTIRIKLEVSNIASQTTTRSGTIAYQIGTRTAGTVLKLKDGENQVLAGLISDDDRRSANKVPGLGDIPLLGRLFSQQQDNGTKREIVLSITPRIIRNIPRPELLYAEIDAGTEASLKNRAAEGGSAAGAAGVPGVTGAPVFAPPLPSGAGAAPVPGAVPGGALGTPLPSGAMTTPNGGAGAAPSLGNAPTAAPSGPASLQWQGPAQTNVGQSITLALMLQPGEAITGVPMSVGFDPKLLQITAITEGDLLKQGGGQTSYTSRIDAATGQAFMTVTRTSPEGATQPGSVVTLTLRALAAGQASVQVLSFAGIGLGGRSVAAPLPEPFRLTISP